MSTPKKIGVVITTYNSPDWLAHVLTGYEQQIDADYRVLIADDGSSAETRRVIDTYKARGVLKIEHYWQEDNGFQKTKILNKVISDSGCDYLIFTDGDCIPRRDFVAVHRSNSELGFFLSGGYIKLTTPVSNSISEEAIKCQRIFDKHHLILLGQPKNFKLMKLTDSKILKVTLNKATPTKATWNGMNSSGWVEDIIAVNGFDERMQYGGLDRELGERLWNKGIRSKQIRYSAICLHLDHPRGYSTPEIWEKNNAIRKEVRTQKLTWTDYGISSQTNQE